MLMGLCGRLHVSFCFSFSSFSLDYASLHVHVHKHLLPLPMSIKETHHPRVNDFACEWYAEFSYAVSQLEASCKPTYILTFDFKQQVVVRFDFILIVAFATVGQIGRNENPANFTNSHATAAFVPAFHLDYAENFTSLCPI